ncbi:hypothetical protein ACIQZG_14410 [Lysinibacillus sp. NPDC096418]|uniref:hypothetical protein n=1 Tax=Lysinibacillus sp. NPDC096418 TaxID=3364138 RepID=UPI003813DF44
MGKRTETSWKQDHPSTLFGNSVQKAYRLLKHAKQHPEEMAVEHAFDQIFHAENSFANAVQHGEHLDMVQQNKELLEQIRHELHEVQNNIKEQ